MHHEKPGIDNTEATIEAALRYGAEHGIRNIVVASTTGFTAPTILNKTPAVEFNITAVTHNTGFGEEGSSRYRMSHKGGLFEQIFQDQGQGNNN
jgi:uncharacterized protein